MNMNELNPGVISIVLCVRSLAAICCSAFPHFISLTYPHAPSSARIGQERRLGRVKYSLCGEKCSAGLKKSCIIIVRFGRSERIIERLKEQRDRDEREKSEELESNKKELKELKEKVSLLQGDLSDREASVLDLKEHASSLASSGLKKDSKLKSLEIALEQKKEECTKLENQLKKAQSVAVEAQVNAGLSERIATLEQEVARYKEDAGKAQTEVDRLLEILREMENEKNDKDHKINELESFPALWSLTLDVVLTESYSDRSSSVSACVFNQDANGRSLHVKDHVLLTLLSCPAFQVNPAHSVCISPLFLSFFLFVSFHWNAVYIPVWLQVTVTHSGEGRRLYFWVVSHYCGRLFCCAGLLVSVPPAGRGCDKQKDFCPHSTFLLFIPSWTVSVGTLMCNSVSAIEKKKKNDIKKWAQKAWMKTRRVQCPVIDLFTCVSFFPLILMLLLSLPEATLVLKCSTVFLVLIIWPLMQHKAQYREEEDDRGLRMGAEGGLSTTLCYYSFKDIGVGIVSGTSVLQGIGCTILQCRQRKQENSGTCWDRMTPGFRPVWHMKDQSKKVANLKHKEQVEKSKNAQLMEEARKREDNISESSQQVQDGGLWWSFPLFWSEFLDRKPESAVNVCENLSAKSPSFYGGAVFMEGLFFLFAVDLWTTMPQRPSLCCGFLCFSWLLVCSFDHSPFSHFPCSVSCVLCFRSSSYAIFLTAGLMCYWTSTCGTRRLERQCVRAHEYVLRSKRAHLCLQGPSFLRGVTLPQAHIVAYAPPFEAP
ncbi:hypothetical protein PO909_028669 [Leuciscus waleckii]